MGCCLSLILYRYTTINLAVVIDELWSGFVEPLDVSSDPVAVMCTMGFPSSSFCDAGWAVALALRIDGTLHTPGMWRHESGAAKPAVFNLLEYGR